MLRLQNTILKKTSVIVRAATTQAVRIFAVLAFGVLVSLPNITVAAEKAETHEANHGEDHGAEAVAHESVGLPQLDSSTFVTQIFWTLVMCALIYRMLTTKGLPLMYEVLGERRKRIDKELLQAEADRKQAISSRDSSGHILQDARKNAAALRSKADAEAAANIHDSLEAIKGQLESDLAKADAELNSRILDTEKQIYTVAESVTVDVLAKLAGLKIRPEDVRKTLQALPKSAT